MNGADDFPPAVVRAVQRRVSLQPQRHQSAVEPRVQQVQVPPRYARVNAWVISHDTDAEVRWLATVFGAVETPGSRMLDPDGDIGHVEVEIGDSVIMLFDAKPGWPLTPAHLRVYVGDVAAAVDAAVAAGARVVTRPTLLAFGERVARIRDPQGICGGCTSRWKRSLPKN